MLTSTHTKGAPQAFSIKTETLPDGRIKAYCKAHPQVGEVISDVRSHAIASMSNRLQRYNDNGLQVAQPIRLNADRDADG